MDRDLKRLIDVAFSLIQEAAPEDSGNLKRDGVKPYIGISEAHLHIDERIAPYMKYTNEPWYNFAPPLFGKTNPNEGWFDRAVTGAIFYIKDKTGGRLT